jgi:hypothetical protein
MGGKTGDPRDDPAEGSREVAEDNLKRRKDQADKAEKERDSRSPPSHPPREDKELGPKGVP